MMLRCRGNGFTHHNERWPLESMPALTAVRAPWCALVGADRYATSVPDNERLARMAVQAEYDISTIRQILGWGSPLECTQRGRQHGPKHAAAFWHHVHYVLSTKRGNRTPKGLRCLSPLRFGSHALQLPLARRCLPLPFFDDTVAECDDPCSNDHSSSVSDLLARYARSLDTPRVP